MELFLSTTNLLISFWIGFGAVCLLLVSRSSLTFNRKLLIVPLTFIALYVTISSTVNLLGLPFSGKPEGNFTFVAFKVVTNEAKEQVILLWVEQQQAHRLYKLPYDEDTKNKLKKAKSRQKKGIMQQGKFLKKKKDRLGTPMPSPLEIYDFPFQELIPK